MLLKNRGICINTYLSICVCVCVSSIMRLYSFMWLIHSANKNLMLNKMRLLVQIYHEPTASIAINPISKREQRPCKYLLLIRSREENMGESK